MKYSVLGRTGLNVSRLCLGPMTFGEQNSEKDGHEQLDLALNAGVNFIDTAEIYSVPPGPETYGATERVIGTWFKRRGQRDRIILATKAARVPPGCCRRPRTSAAVFPTSTARTWKRR